MKPRRSPVNVILLITIYVWLLSSCVPPRTTERPRSGICMADGMNLFKNAKEELDGMKLLGLGDSLIVYSDSSSFSVRDTVFLFRRVSLVSDSTWAGWVKAGELAIDCRHAAINHDHAEIYSDDLTPLDTLSYMRFVAIKPSHITGYVKVYTIHPISKKMIAGLIPENRLTTDPASTDFAISFETNRDKPSWLRSLFRTSDKNARQSEFFVRTFKRELDSARSHGIDPRVMANRLAVQFLKDTSKLIVSAFVLDIDGKPSDSPLQNSYSNEGVNFRTWVVGKGKIRINVQSSATQSTPQDSIVVNGVAVHFVDTGFCRDNTTISVSQNGMQSYRRVVEFHGGD